MNESGPNYQADRIPKGVDPTVSWRGPQDFAVAKSAYYVSTREWDTNRRPDPASLGQAAYSKQFDTTPEYPITATVPLPAGTSGPVYLLSIFTGADGTEYYEQYDLIVS